MTAITPTIKLFTSQDHDSIAINNLILEYRGNHYHLHGGTGDSVYVFTESIAIYVLTVNKAKGYMALNAYMVPQPDAINGVCLHTPGQIKEHLGDKWDHMPARSIVEKLINYLM